MLTEKFGISQVSEGHENAIWQCPEIYTCQAVVRLMDNRTNEVHEFNLFYTLTDFVDPKAELERIVNALGYSNCGIVKQEFRKTMLDSYNLHCKGHPVD